MLQAEFFSTNAVSVCENLSFYFSSGPKFGSDTGTEVRIHSGSETGFGSDQTKRTEAFPYLRPFSPRTFCVLVAMMMISVLVGVTRTSTPLYPSSASSRVNSSFSSAYAQHYLEHDYTEHTLLLSVADPDPGSGAFLTPGSGMGFFPDPGSQDHILKSFDNFFGKKFYNSLKIGPNFFFGTSKLII